MDNELADVYNDLILEHSMNSYNKKKLQDATCSKKGHNPNCGDEIELQIKVKDEIIEDLAFTGHRMRDFSSFYFYYDRYFKR